MWVIHLLVWIFRQLEEAEKRGRVQQSGGRLELEGAAPQSFGQRPQAPVMSVPQHRPQSGEALWPQERQPQQPRRQPSESPRLQQDRHRQQQAGQRQPQQPRPEPLPPVHVHRKPVEHFVHHTLPPMVDDAPGGPIDWFLRLLEGVRR